MIDIPSDNVRANGIVRIGTQPIALAAIALVILLVGAGSIAIWRVSTGTSPETERMAAVRQLQARTAQAAAQASEQLTEKTKGLEASQQESIDQLQQLQDEVQTVKRLLASQQAEAKKLTDQVSTLATSVDSLRQSFASAQAETSTATSARKSTRPKFRAARSTQRRPKPAT